MNRQPLMLLCLVSLVSLAGGCSSLDAVDTANQEKNASAIASFHDFNWAGVVESDNCYRPTNAIDQQLLYTVGQLNGVNSVGRLDQVEISDSAWEETETGCRITYTARMPVAWGNRGTIPDAYTLILPRNVGRDAHTQAWITPSRRSS